MVGRVASPDAYLQVNTLPVKTQPVRTLPACTLPAATAARRGNAQRT